MNAHAGMLSVVCCLLSVVRCLLFVGRRALLVDSCPTGDVPDSSEISNLKFEISEQRHSAAAVRMA
jgi:hypothetical protein